MRSKALVAVAIAVGVIVGALAGLGGRSPGPVPLQSPVPGDEAQELIDVHVAGMVVSPGVVQVPAGSIVADAIAAAGGMRLGAMTEAINLAAPLRSGDQVVVPGGSSGDVAVDDGRVSLNRATAAELEALPGVGPVLAERIVAFREENGSFDTVEDLLSVPGIGESKLAALRDLVRVP